MEKTLEIYVWRFARLAEYTISRLYIDGEYICDTMEDKDYGFDCTTDVGIICQAKKMHPAAVAIPWGRYEVDTKYARGFANTHPWYKSQPLGSHIPCLVRVPGYSGILIHCGSNKDHTAGCIIVGYNKVKGALVDSKQAYIKVVTAIRNANAKGMKTFINIFPDKPDFIQ